MGRITYTGIELITQKGGKPMKRLLIAASVCLALLVTVSPVVADTVTAEQAFDHLKGLEGTWEG